MSDTYKFTYKTLGDLTAEIESRSLAIPTTEDFSSLSRRVKILGVETPNALAVHPMEGFDGTANGAPGELTVRRYERFASGGAGLFWFEATSVCREGRSSNRQLWINEENVDDYKRLVNRMHELSGGAPVICQLTHSGRFAKPDNIPAPLISYHNPIMNERLNLDPSLPVVTDDYLDGLHDKYLDACRLAKEAGFDGVDIKSCHRYLLSELLSAYCREGKYGGSYENRTRLLRETVKDAVSLYGADDFIIGTRMSVSDCIPYPYGFCTTEDGEVDLAEAKKLLSELHASGMSLLNLSMGTPYYNPHVNRPYDSGGYEPPESPLVGVERMINASREIKAAVPGLKIIGTGYSYLRHLSPNVAAAVLDEGAVDMAGFGRMAFAYPDFARDMIAEKFDPKKTCISCGNCVQLMRRIATAGCPIRDPLYRPIFIENCGGKPNMF